MVGGKAAANDKGRGTGKGKKSLMGQSGRSCKQPNEWIFGEGFVKQAKSPGISSVVGYWNEGRVRRRSSEKEVVGAEGVRPQEHNGAPYHSYIPCAHGRMWVLPFQAQPAAAIVLRPLGGLAVGARARFFVS